MKTTNRNIILLLHGIFLLFVTGANTIVSLIGMNTGEGVFGFVKELPIAEVGLFQAYLLMMAIGIVLLMNVKNKDSWKYDILGCMVHLIPLSALLLFQDVVKEIMGVEIFIASSLIHTPWIIIESITAIVKYRKAHEKSI